MIFSKQYISMLGEQTGFAHNNIEKVMFVIRTNYQYNYHAAKISISTMML